ncbi:MAG TPA: ATP-binding protein [Planctomycetota bacterium]|nr:ATP-binding protein [Planctomycetota bacterium]
MSAPRENPVPTRAGIATRVEALGYRSLRYVAQDLGPFHVLVGPNAGGKSTFLDVLALLGDIVRVGAQGAIEGEPRLGIPHRAPDGKHLTWLRQGARIELVVEFSIPADRLSRLRNGGEKANGERSCRYEVALDVGAQLQIASETLWLQPVRKPQQVQRDLFPSSQPAPDNIVHLARKRMQAGWRKVLWRGEEPANVTFSSETGNWNSPFRIAQDKAALASLPEDETKFPVATWFRQALANGVQRIALSAEGIRQPCPPSRTRGLLPDGSNLPFVVNLLETQHPDRLRAWVAHVQEALPDLKTVSTREREEDRHRYLVIGYTNGLEAPSWLVSDGTLRLLALTLLAYVPELTGTYLIEEPENGIHPRAVETVFQSLSSVYDAQVLLATHSPVVLSMANLDQVLCFARASDGATDVVPGRMHPRLRDWKGDVDLGSLLASGVLS